MTAGKVAFPGAEMAGDKARAGKPRSAPALQQYSIHDL